MIIELLLYLLRFAAIILVQVLAVNNIELSSYINPYIYVAFILMLPVTIRPWLLVIISFLTGGVMDAFSSTPGLHMAATTLMGYMRIHYLRFATTKEDIEGRVAPSISQKGFVWFGVYGFVLIFLHHLVLFFLEIYGFSEFFSTLTKAFLSALVSLLIIFVAQLLFYRNRQGNG